MKIVLVLVSVAGLAAVGGAIYVGARLKEPTVVADPYQAGLHYDEHRRAAAAKPTSTATSTPTPPSTPTSTSCDLQTGPCKQPLAGGGEVTLAVEPRPVRAMRDVEFTVIVTPPSAAAGSDVTVVLTMPGMHMGETRAALAPAGEGVFRGKGVVVRCPSGRRDWAADVVLHPGGPPGAPSPSAGTASPRSAGTPLAPGQPPPAAPALATSRQQAPRFARFLLTVAE